MLKIASKLPPRWLKIATWAQLGSTWLHLGLILCPQEAPRGAQEASKTPPRGSKRPPRGPRSLIFNIKTSISCGRGYIFLSYPLACNMSPLGSRRGPALRASIRRPRQGGTGVLNHLADSFRLLRLRLLPGHAIPPTRTLNARVYPLNDGVYCPRTPFAGSSSATLPPSCLQDAAKTAHDGKMTARPPQDADLRRTSTQLGPT